MDMKSTFNRNEATATQSALKSLLSNLGFQNVKVHWPSGGDLVTEGVPFESIFLYCEITTTRQQRHIADEDEEFIPSLHVQIIEGLAGKRSTKWVSYGAGLDWHWQFRVLEADRKRENFHEGVVQLRIEATKKMHEQESTTPLPSRDPKWV